MPPIIRTLGRTGVAGMFILAGIAKILDPETAQGMLQEGGLTPVAFFHPATVALEIGFGLMVAIGGRIAVPACFALIIFTLAANVIYHPFWEMDGLMARLEISLFFKNMAVVFALIYIASVEIGRARSGRTTP